MQQITKDNFIKTLKYNRFSAITQSNDDVDCVRSIKESITVISIENVDKKQLYHIQHEEVTIDRNRNIVCILKSYDFNDFVQKIKPYIDLKPLPEFDFKLYLMDNGFKEEIDFNEIFINVYNDEIKTVLRNDIVTVLEIFGGGWFYSVGKDQEINISNKSNKKFADMLINIANCAKQLND
jgi:hypothetical protein